MQLLPTKLELVDIEVNHLHILIKLLQNAEGPKISDISTSEIFTTLNLIEEKFITLEDKLMECINEQNS